MKRKNIIKVLSTAAKALVRSPARSSTERRIQHSQDMDKQFRDAGLRARPSSRQQKQARNQHPELPKKTYEEFLRWESDNEARSYIKWNNKKR